MNVRDYEHLKQKKYSELSKKEAIKLWNYRTEIKKQVAEYNRIKENEKMSEENGIYNKKRTEKTPDWIVCQLGIKVDELKPNDKGYVNIDICKSKDGSYCYPKINEWQPTKKEEKKETENIVEFIDEEVPF